MTDHFSNPPKDDDSLESRVGIALGSNVGNRLSHLRMAVDLLKKIAVPGTPFLEASIYQTEPVHCPPDSPLFYNTVVELSFRGNAENLLQMTQAAEKKLGRLPSPVRNAPRTIDIDLLYFGEEILETTALILPHPRLQERRFVLEPLAEICGERILPGHETSIAGLLAGLESDEAPLVKVQGV